MTSTQVSRFLKHVAESGKSLAMAVAILVVGIMVVGVIAVANIVITYALSGHWS